MSEECEIINVPVDDAEEEQETPISPIEKVKKRKGGYKAGTRVLTEEQKQKCRDNLAKARATRKLMLDKERKEREEIEREYDQAKLTEVEVEEDSPYEDGRKILRRSKPKGRKPKTQLIVEKKRPKRKRKAEPEEESDSGSDSWESEEEPEPPKKPRKTKPRAPKVKKISEKEMRLLLLERKIDEIITHTKASLEKPRSRTVKSTTTIIQTPKETASAANPQLKAAAQKLLAMF